MAVPRGFGREPAGWQVWEPSPKKERRPLGLGSSARNKCIQIHSNTSTQACQCFLRLGAHLILRNRLGQCASRIHLLHTSLRLTIAVALKTGKALCVKPGI